MILNTLFKNTTYDDSLFSDEARQYVEQAVFMETVREKEVPQINCLVRNKKVRVTPEEAVRQLYLYVLIHDYNYPADRIKVEYPIHFGREVKRADIATCLGC